MMIVPIVALFNPQQTGYIAGTQDGIVTVNGVPAARKIWLLSADYFTIIATQVSLANGHYLFTGLDTNVKYLILCRDYEGQYEPAVWDYVTPATDLTIAEQQELWESWQTLP